MTEKSFRRSIKYVVTPANSTSDIGYVFAADPKDALEKAREALKLPEDELVLVRQVAG